MSSPVTIQPFDGQSVCLFCGSSDLSDPAYTAAARAFGEQTALAGWRLVYGGGGVGLMLPLAESVANLQFGSRKGYIALESEGAPAVFRNRLLRLAQPDIAPAATLGIQHDE